MSLDSIFDSGTLWEPDPANDWIRDLANTEDDNSHLVKQARMSVASIDRSDDIIQKLETSLKELAQAGQKIYDLNDQLEAENQRLKLALANLKVEMALLKKDSDQE